MSPVEVRYFPICREHGERPRPVLARALDVRCDVCNGEIDAFQPRLVLVAATEAA